MYVVFYTIYNNCFTVRFIDQVANNPKEYVFPFFADNFFADNCISIFYCKNSLQTDLMVSICYAKYFF